MARIVWKKNSLKLTEKNWTRDKKFNVIFDEPEILMKFEN
jgi:hypothetical protein